MSREGAAGLLACVLVLIATVGCDRVPASQAAETTETDLEARIEAPSALTTGETVPLRFTLTNETDSKLYVLEWYTPLEGIKGKIFRVECDGEVVPYRGILATRAAPSPDDYALLEPGASASAEVDLATAYEFARPGTYTIQFLSPNISHVARHEAEMASSLDDLGPVEMPANKDTVQIRGTAPGSSRPGPEEAENMIRDYLQSQNPSLGADTSLPMAELPVPEVWDHMPVQLFRVTDGPFARETFLTTGETVLPLGTAVGGDGVTSIRISDLDEDDSPELLFTYSFGSGLHQSRIGMYAPAYGNSRVYEAGTTYLGDVRLFKADMSQVAVRALGSNDGGPVAGYAHTLGYLAIQKHDDDVRLMLQVVRDLPDDVRRNLLDPAREAEEGTYGGWAMYASADNGFAFRYPPPWSLEEEANLVKLSQGRLLLAISFQRQDEDVPPPWSGMPAGELKKRGTVTFLDQEIEKKFLVYEGKVKLLAYDAQVGDVIFSIRLEDVGTADYDAIQIAQTVRSEVDRIVGSFETR